MISKTISHLNWRAAIKDYDSTLKLTKKQVDLLVEVARMAPTSYGLQPIKIYVVSNSKTKEKLQKAGYGQPQFTNASHIFVLAARENIIESDIEEYIQRVSVQRSVKLSELADFKKMLLLSVSGKSKQELHSWATKQAYLVLGMMLAVASDQKIDTTPMEGFSPSEFDKIIGIDSEGFKSIVVMAAGFRDEADKYSKMPKVRKIVSEFAKQVD